MRSTQKKGPRTLGLKRSRSMKRRPGFRQVSALELLAAFQTSAVVSAMWSNAQAKAHGSAADAIARAAGFREPPEPEPATQNTPTKPPPMSGGAEACKEIPMTITSSEELQRQHHEIARMAADAAGRVASHVPYDRQAMSLLAGAPSPASAGKAVADAYEAALKQLSAGCAPGTPGSAASV